MPNPFERAARSVDHLQRRVTPAAFAFAVVKKFGDDRGSNLAALVTYYGFLSVFPLLLVLVTILGWVGGASASTAHSIEHSALSQFPVIGSQLGHNIHELHRHSILSLAVGLVGLLYGSQGASQSGQFAMAEIWNVPAVDRPNYLARLGRSMALVVGLGVALVASTGLAGVSSFVAGRAGLRAVSLVLTLVVNMVLYLFAFRALTPKSVPTRPLVPGALTGGAAWTVLQVIGTAVVDHTLRNTSQIYGFFAIVLGLMAWIYLGAQVTLYCAEANVVLARRLWPRSIVQPPLTEADERVYASLVRQSPRRPEVTVTVHTEPTAADPSATEPTAADPTAADPPAPPPER